MFVNIDVLTGVVSTGIGPKITSNFTNGIAYAFATSGAQSACSSGKNILIGTVVDDPFDPSQQTYFFSTFDANTGGTTVYPPPPNTPLLPIGEYYGSLINAYAPPFQTYSQASSATGAYGTFIEYLVHQSGKEAGSFAFYDASTAALEKIIQMPPFEIWCAAFIFY